MTAIEYANTVSTLMNVATLIADLPLAEVRAAIDRAETLGPFIDPTVMQRFLNDPKARTRSVLSTTWRA